MGYTEGQLIAFLLDNGIRCGVVLNQAGKKVQLVDVNGKQRAINENQIVTGTNRKATVNTVKEMGAALEAEAAALAAELEVELLWESLPDHESGYLASELAELYFSDKSAPAALAVFNTLLDDQLYFKHRNGLFVPRTREQFARQQQEQERIAAKEQFRRDAAAWIEATLSASEAAESHPRRNEFLGELELFLLQRQKTPIGELLAELFPDTPREKAYELLEECDRLPEGVDPLQLIAGIRKEFSPEAVEQAAGLKPFQNNDGRTPVTAPFCCSIDDESTREIDDAISVEETETRLILGVHIADLTPYIEPDSPLDREALHRVVTVYLPATVITMLPENISCGLASLNCSEERPCLSLYAEFDPSSMQLTDWNFVRGTVTVRERLSYSEADRRLASDPGFPLALAEKAASELHRRRLAAEAVSINRPELKITVRDGEISMKRLDDNSRSAKLVQELMILFNSLAAEFSLQNGLPVIFRAQDPPQDPNFPTGVDLPYDPVRMPQLFKSLRPAKLSLEPKPHHGLGVQQYIQVSSPLRRYADLVMQRQLNAFLAGRSLPYNKGDMYRILASAETTEREISAIERRSVRYWSLEYLQRCHSDDVLGGIITMRRGGSCLVELDAYPLRGLITKSGTLDAGERVQVRISKINPRKDILQFIQV